MNTTKTKTNKFEYYKVIQQYMFGTWEDVDFFEAKSNGIAIDVKAVRANLKTYKENTNYPTRVIFRKEKIAVA